MKTETRYFAVTNFSIQEVDPYWAADELVSGGWNVWHHGSDAITACLVRVGRGKHFNPIRQYPEWVKAKIADYIQKYPERRATEMAYTLTNGWQMKETGVFSPDRWAAIWAKGFNNQTT